MNTINRIILGVPSEDLSTPWLVAENLRKNYPKPTKNSGKYLLFFDKSEIDHVWELIRTHTYSGALTRHAKVSTALKRNNSNNDSHVVCIYTYDYNDEKDMADVKEKLKQLGFVNKIPYKKDSDTRKGIYAN